jgi:hypothetical protein
MKRVIWVAGKKFSQEYLGISETDHVAIRKNSFGANTLVKSSDGENWEVVDCPENYGWPSIQIQTTKTEQ